MISSENGEGVDQWLDRVLTESDGGRRIADVDYDTYAEGEAVLGWLNATYEITGSCPAWKEFSVNLVSGISQELNQAPIGHLKTLIEGGGRTLAANLTSARSVPMVHGEAPACQRVLLTLNVRIEAPPEVLSAAAEAALSRALGEDLTAVNIASHCLSPGRPNPTHRFSHVVEVN